ncbi:MAG: GNAT family N-acetyltransferase [Candidatus Nanopelagicaceae bacterium]
MINVTLRKMTGPEFDVFRVRLIAEYAAENVSAGRWSAEEAEEKSTAQTQELLPQGVETPRVLVMIAEDSGGERIGHVWVGLDRKGAASGGAWIYDIEVAENHRGKGYGRAILHAAEQETLKNGVSSIGLNVFGKNTVARSLYESAGYEITTQQMQKSLEV